ncbi:hypothetical protein Hanom_Chr04g00349521 [Helianthus anomalus]
MSSNNIHKLSNFSSLSYHPSVTTSHDHHHCRHLHLTIPWVAAAITTDALVAYLLLHIKRSSSLPTPAPPLSLNPPGWGDHKSRTKPSIVPTIEGLKPSAL